MGRSRKFVAAVVVSAMTLPLGGCAVKHVDIDLLLTLSILYLRAIRDRKTDAVVTHAKRTRESDTFCLQATGTIGGLDGTYDIDLGTYGTVAGTAQIQGQKRAKIKDDADADTLAIVESALQDRLGIEVDVTEAKVTVKGSQTTGGATVKYTGKIAYRGVVLSGDEAGTQVKGTMKAKGKF